MSDNITPGPYSAGVSLHKGVEHFAVAVVGNEQKLVALTGVVGGNDEPESIANAYLFAAAPDLLASCRELLNCIQTDRDSAEGKRARLAIARAEGRAA